VNEIPEEKKYAQKTRMGEKEERRMDEKLEWGSKERHMVK